MGLKRLFWNYTGSTGDDLTYFTPADRFYHVDHGDLPGPIDPASWRLRVCGRVADPREFTLADLQARLASAGITRYAKTLQCLRDPLGDKVENRWYASSGLWGGLPMASILAESGVAPGAVRVSYGGRDGSGFFASLPIGWAMAPRDGLPVLLATELNGQPLTHQRGGPVRVVVPDGLGFKSIKWLDWIRVVDDPVPDGWYERGRGVRLPPRQKDPTLKTIARIAPVIGPGGRPTHPRLGTFRAGQFLSFRGYAVPGPRGLSTVRFRVTVGHQIGGGGIVHEGVRELRAARLLGAGRAAPAGYHPLRGRPPDALAVALCLGLLAGRVRPAPARPVRVRGLGRRPRRPRPARARPRRAFRERPPRGRHVPRHLTDRPGARAMRGPASLIALILLGAAPPDDLARLQGAWTCVSMERNGKPIPPDRFEGGRLVMDGDRFTFTRDGQVVTQGTRKLDPSKSPRAVDDTHTLGTFQGKTYRGIYAIDGDTFRTCNGSAGQDRPTSFATTPGSGLLLVVYRREAAKPAP